MMSGTVVGMLIFLVSMLLGNGQEVCSLPLKINMVTLYFSY